MRKFKLILELGELDLVEIVAHEVRPDGKWESFELRQVAKLNHLSDRDDRWKVGYNPKYEEYHRGWSFLNCDKEIRTVFLLKVIAALIEDMSCSGCESFSGGLIDTSELEKLMAPPSGMLSAPRSEPRLCCRCGRILKGKSVMQVTFAGFARSLCLSCHRKTL